MPFMPVPFVPSSSVVVASEGRQAITQFHLTLEPLDLWLLFSCRSVSLQPQMNLDQLHVRLVKRMAARGRRCADKTDAEPSRPMAVHKKPENGGRGSRQWQTQIAEEAWQWQNASVAAAHFAVGVHVLPHCTQPALHKFGIP